MLLDVLFQKLVSPDKDWYLELTGYLLDENTFNYDEKTRLLHFACCRRLTDLVKTVVEHPSSINVCCVDKYGNTTLMWAVTTYCFGAGLYPGKLSLDLVRYLIESGANIGARHTHPGHPADGYSVIDFLRYNLERGVREEIEKILLPHFDQQFLNFRTQKLICWNPYLKDAHVTALGTNEVEKGVRLSDGTIVKYSSGECDGEIDKWYEFVEGKMRKVEVLGKIQ